MATTPPATLSETSSSIFPVQGIALCHALQPPPHPIQQHEESETKKNFNMVDHTASVQHPTLPTLQDTPTIQKVHKHIVESAIFYGDLRQVSTEIALYPQLMPPNLQTCRLEPSLWLLFTNLDIG
ncbi:hypothetical protein EW146_g2590 [Bondarzewia mesenterica]|uniref:Uncharacterized protein n=1 Tax=Bondarzewia mesenterica TaxID=1095465 RepID=A0A4S4M063_9AGAM|nr:hypothetical protein EW146_g2590 [Bondarzewia mesenterica]